MAGAACPGPAPRRSTHDSSVDPPPTSTTRAAMRFPIQQDRGSRPQTGWASSRVANDVQASGPSPPGRGRRRRRRWPPSGRPGWRWRRTLRQRRRRDLFGAHRFAGRRGCAPIASGLQPPAGRQALAQSDHPRERFDHAKALRRRRGDQQPAVVGAEIQRAVGARFLRRPAAPAAAPGRRGVLRLRHRVFPSWPAQDDPVKPFHRRS